MLNNKLAAYETNANVIIHLVETDIPYPELGANPSGDHAIDRTQGRRSRDKQVGNKQPESNSAYINEILQ